MFIKNILKAFNRDTKIAVFLRINDDALNICYKELDTYNTVGDFMDSGLMTYMEVNKDMPFYIINNTIIIYIG